MSVRVSRKHRCCTCSTSSLYGVLLELSGTGGEDTVRYQEILSGLQDNLATGTFESMALDGSTADDTQCLNIYVRLRPHSFTKSIFSLIPIFTLFTLPSRARASPALSSTAFSSTVSITSPCCSVLPSLSASIASSGSSFTPLVSALLVLNIGPATLTLMVCVGLLHKFHRNLNPSLHPGTGVVTSGGAYLSEIGKILTFGGASSKLGENGRIALPFVVVLSGRSRMGRLGCLAMSADRVVNCEAFSCESTVSGCRQG